VSLDDRRFLLLRQSGDAAQNQAPASITVVQNWFEELKRLVPLQ